MLPVGVVVWSVGWAGRLTSYPLSTLNRVSKKGPVQLGLVLLQYGKTAKFYVYSPGEIDLNALINRCKEMPRKRGPEGKPKHYAVPPEQMVKQDHFVHSNPPKGKLLY